MTSPPSLPESLRKELPPARGVLGAVLDESCATVLAGEIKVLPAGWDDAPLRFHPLGPTATLLVTRGYRVLLMGGDQGKVPLGAKANQPNGYKSATDDLCTLEERLRLAGETATGLGVVVGGHDAPLVIDADGPCAVRTLFDLVGDALMAVPRERTRKGMHFFFRPDPTVRRAIRGIPVNCTCGHDCGIDILGSSSAGAANGIVTVAPSPGKAWIWPDGGLSEPSPFPELFQVLRNIVRKTVPTDQAPIVVLTEADRQAARGVLGGVLDEACATVRAGIPGQRHSVLLAAAQRVGQVLGAAGYDAASELAKSAVAALTEASEASGHDHVDAKRTARDGVKWGIARPRPMAVGRDAEIARFVAAVVEALRACPVPTPGSLEQAQEQIAQALLDENSGVIQASTGVGKTHILKQFGRASASRPRRGMWPSRVEPEPEPEEPRQLSLRFEDEPEPESEPEPEPWPEDKGEGGGGLGRFARKPPWEIPPLAAFFPTRELRDDFAAAVGLPYEAVHCGRHELGEEDRQRLEATPRWKRGSLYLAPWTCPILPTVRPISERNHILMASACSNCSHGFAAQIKLGVHMLSEEGEDDEQQGIARLVGKLQARGLQPNEVAPCPYILAVAQECQEMVLAATHAAATDSMGRMALSVYRRDDDETGKSKKSLARTVVFDEEATWVKKVVVHRRDVTEWRERADEICRGLREKAETQLLEDWRRELFLDTLEKWRRLFNQKLDKFERAIWSLDRPNLDAVASVLPNLLTLCDWLMTVTDRQHGLFSDEPDQNKAKKRAGKTALWEKVKIRWDGTDLEELIAPLRALRTIEASTKVGTAEVVEQTEPDESVARAFVAWGLTAQGEMVLKQRTGTKVLSATPSRGLLAATQTHGGEHARAVLSQPVKILATFDAGWGVSHQEQAERRKEQAVGLFGNLLPQLAQGLGVSEDEIGLISHKPWIEMLRTYGGISENRSRWWGAEQGVNMLEAVKALVIAGLPAIPHGALRDVYCGERFFALTAGADEEAWPVWSQHEPWVLHPTVMVGGQDVEWPQGLPENERLRSWVLDWYARRMVQALGRVRALQRDGEAPAVIILGPCPDLSDYGFGITPLLGGELYPAASANTRGAVRRVETEARVAAIMLEMRQEGAKETCRAIAERARETTGKGCGPGVVRRVRLREASGETLEEIVQASARTVGVALREGTIRKLRQDLPERVRSLIEASAHARPVRLALRPRDADARGVSCGTGDLSRRGPPIGLAV